MSQSSIGHYFSNKGKALVKVCSLRHTGTTEIIKIISRILIKHLQSFVDAVMFIRLNDGGLCIFLNGLVGGFNGEFRDG